MLQTQTVVPELMELLKKIMSEKLFSDFNLVGVTSLALQMGHRNSIDIDMFGNSEINSELFIEKLSEFGEVKVAQSTKNILTTKINDVKVDFVNYKYQLLTECLHIENIRMLSTKDIAAMKLNAIAGRGSKKDFIDLYFLLNEFSLEEMVSFYEKKYSNGSIFMVQKSLAFFEDADSQLQPKMFKDFNWEDCKQKIVEEVLKL
ncbi:nucleotidyl transferase AbiEii/AbiGii toxin family protein [Flavobacterium sp.]|uniref:nucleotidyl transferase AbiEii/AbiGii toxin family protein n=1 Tax=Flavobacterium sp. TaxID=239 RepID=UPI00286DBAE1|nr:nucleotidyl transferase AbiEii/AbiGii toxin family protein [Flavobacterium sp.]